MKHVIDRSPLLNLPGKRLYDHGGSCSHGYPLNMKRQKIETSPQFLRACRPPSAPLVCQTVDSKAFVLVPLNPLVTKDLSCECNKPVVTRDKGNPGKPLATLKNVTKGRVPKSGTLPRRSEDLNSQQTWPKPSSFSLKYPPPKIREGVCVVRDFPLGNSNVYFSTRCGGELANCGSHSPDEVLAGEESGLERRPLTETVCKSDIQSEHEIDEGSPASYAMHDIPEGCEGRANCIPSSKYQVVKVGEPCLEERCPLVDMVQKVHVKDVACQVQAECVNFIANDTCKPMHSPSECKHKVLGARMGSKSEICSREKLSRENNFELITQLCSKKTSVHEAAEVTCDYNGLKSRLNGAEGSDFSLATQDSKAMEVSECSLINKIKLLERNSSVNKSFSIGIMSMKDVPRERENYRLIRESNNQVSLPDKADLNRIEVIKVLNLFDDIYGKLLQQLEAKPKSGRKQAAQIPVQAAMIAKQRLSWSNINERVLGVVPGIEVGDQFRFRAQLALIGLHCHFTSGIDYMKKEGKIIATSIVDSGRYAHKKHSNQYTEESDLPHVFTYFGQGGNPQVAYGKCQMKPEDQKLEGGNLALKNSMEARSLVRVIRKLQISPTFGISAKRGKTATFLYHGLYVVSNCTQEIGPYGKLIFKFRFTRVNDGPKVAKCLVREKGNLEVHNHSRVVDEDISQGKEKFPMRAINSIDEEKPPLFKYSTKVVSAEDFDEGASYYGCSCVNGCSDFEPCSCLAKNGGEIPFNENGAILKATSNIYECGPSCKCPSSCKNRVSQHGVRHQLEIFKTKSKGWGIRSRNFIARGSFVCEYIGELLSEKEAEKRTNNDEYLFDIGNVHDNHEMPNKRKGYACSHSRFSKRSDDDGFTIDAAEYGNIGRFINHSCSPNLYAQHVFYDHVDKRRSHIMFFAFKNIPPLRELTFDYNYKINQVCDANDNIKKKNCYCGASNCIRRMY